jgi:hypothetical protein
MVNETTTRKFEEQVRKMLQAGYTSIKPTRKTTLIGVIVIVAIK